MFFREFSKGKIRKEKVFWIIPIGLIIYGIIIEVVQGSFTSYRSAEPLDVLANTLGAVLGTLLIKALFSDRSQLKWEN
jgi:VanZ family protein